MKKRLFISVALALVLTVLGSVPVLAAKPKGFEASGQFDFIELPGDMWQAGKSDRWVVVEREITGTLSGDIDGDLIMTYRGNFDLSTQAGTFHGTVTVVDEDDSYVLKVNGRIEPLEMVLTEYGKLPKLTIKGRWLLTEGVKGEGAFSAWLIFIPVGDHVGKIVASEFTLTGQWQPPNND